MKYSIITSFKYVLRNLNSCTTKLQLDNAYNLLYNFMTLYKEHPSCHRFTDKLKDTYFNKSHTLC